MRKTKKQRRNKLGALGELATVGRVYLGRDVKAKDGSHTELTDGFLEHAAQVVADATTGGVTMTKGRGIYTGLENGKRWTVKERSATFTAIVPEATGSCTQVARRMRNAAKHLARRGQQESVLVEVRCADGREDAALVDKRGRVQPLFPLRFKERRSSRK